MASTISNGVDQSSTDTRNPSEQKPVIPKHFIKEIVNRLYGMNVTDWKELNSYDDKNFHINISPDINNKYIDVINPSGYVLKVLNSEDSKDPLVIDAQHQLFHHLHKKQFPVQEPVCNVNGKTWSVETVPDETDNNRMNGPYVFHMLKYIDGDVVYHKPYYPRTLFNIGVFAGKLHKAFEGFEQPFFKNRSFLWSLTELPALSDYTFAVKDVDNLDLVNNVIKAFQQDVIPQYGNLTKGYVHGDMNEQNILVQENGEIANDENQWCDVTAFIDFSDMTFSYTVFDVAILIAYMSIESKVVDQLDVGGHILAGYFQEMTLNEAEFDVLHVCVCSRLVQSLVMGAYSYHMDPSNTYVLVTAKRGWPLLWKYWQTPKPDLYKRWNTIINSYVRN